jgi:hypothetical protein
METRQFHRQIHRRYAATKVHSASPSLEMHARRPGTVRRGEGYHREQGQSPFVIVEARAVSARKYKSQYALWLEVSRSREPESGLAANYKEHRSEPDYKEKLLASLRLHVGHWVAIRGADVLASGNSPRDVIDFLRNRNLRADSVFRVPRDARQDTAGER